MSEHCPDGAVLLAFVEGRTELGETERIERHLVGCPACRSEAAALGGLTRALAGAAGSVRRATATDESLTDNAGVRGTTCAEDQDAAAYLDGVLGQSARVRYERHAAGCPSCLEELADLMAARRSDAPRASDEAVAAVLTRLRRERRGVLIRLAKGTLNFVEGWSDGAAALVADRGSGGREPAIAGARAVDAAVSLRCEAEGGYTFDCELTTGQRDSELVGRVLRAGVPAVDVSVSLRGAAAPYGPESVDADGRFGPWTVRLGKSELKFHALNLPGGALALTLDLEEEAGEH